MRIKITVRTSKTLDVGDPEVDEWVCLKGHRISPNTMELVARWDFEDRAWFHEQMGVSCGYTMNMYKKDVKHGAV